MPMACRNSFVLLNPYARAPAASSVRRGTTSTSHPVAIDYVVQLRGKAAVHLSTHKRSSLPTWPRPESGRAGDSRSAAAICGDPTTSHHPIMHAGPYAKEGGRLPQGIRPPLPSKGGPARLKSFSYSDAHWDDAGQDPCSRPFLCPSDMRGGAGEFLPGQCLMCLQQRQAWPGKRPYAACSIRASSQCDQISDSALISRSMSPSECTGEGVTRSRSVPTGTVG